MTETDTGVPCAYCGGRHARAAEVRTCWERSTHGQASPAAGAVGGDAGAGVRSVETGPVLGRSVVVAPGQEPPAAWARCERAGEGIDELEQAWRERTPLVIQVADEPAEDEVERRPVWSLSPAFAFAGERRAQATFANSVDARHGTLRWRLGEVAVRLGATPRGPADVVLPDGTPAFCDGGPLEWRAGIGEAAVVPRLALLAGSLVPFGANDTDAALAPDQLAAVCHPGGAARIIAPAGSGKTRVLTERARHLLRGWGLPGRAVTLVAFNRRAADEMRERTPDLPELQVRTLNALGLSLLATSMPVTTIEEREVRSILDTLVDLPRRANADPAAAWIEALAAVRLGLRAPAEVEAEFGGDVDGLPEVFERYRRLLVERRLVDFDEQIYRAIEVLLADPLARRSARACVPAAPGRRVPGSDARASAAHTAAGGARRRGVRGGRRRPDDLWVLGRLARVADRLPPLLPDGRRAPARGQLPLPAAPSSTPPGPCSPTTAVGCPSGSSPRPGDARVALGSRRCPARTHSPPPSSVVAGLVAERGPLPSDVAVLCRVNASLAPVQVALVHRQIPVRSGRRPVLPVPGRGPGGAGVAPPGGRFARTARRRRRGAGRPPAVAGAVAQGGRVDGRAAGHRRAGAAGRAAQALVTARRSSASSRTCRTVRRRRRGTGPRPPSCGRCATT